MAFAGLFGILIIAAIILLSVIFTGVALIIAGTVLIRKTERKKLGTTLRILGYILALPTVVIAAIVFVVAVMSGAK